MKSAETAEPWVVFTKIPLICGFFLMHNVRAILAANCHIISFGVVTVKKQLQPLSVSMLPAFMTMYW